MTGEAVLLDGKMYVRGGLRRSGSRRRWALLRWSATWTPEVMEERGGRDRSGTAGGIWSLDVGRAPGGAGWWSATGVVEGGAEWWRKAARREVEAVRYGWEW